MALTDSEGYLITGFKLSSLVLKIDGWYLNQLLSLLIPVHDAEAYFSGAYTT